jgi:hypothetical protein
MRRILLSAAVGLGVALPIGGAVLAAAPMAASAAGVSTVKCGTLTGSATGTVTISHCSPTNAKFVSASAPAASLAGGSGTITWSPSGKTTTFTDTFSQATTNRCASSGGTEYDAHGKVTGGTATYTKVGDKVKAAVCLDSSGNLSLVPGTKAGL